MSALSSHCAECDMHRCREGAANACADDAPHSACWACSIGWWWPSTRGAHRARPVDVAAAHRTGGLFSGLARHAAGRSSAWHCWPRTCPRPHWSDWPAAPMPSAFRSTTTNGRRSSSWCFSVCFCCRPSFAARPTPCRSFSSGVTTRRVRLHFALLTLFLNIFVDSAGVLYSGSLVCQLLFPGMAPVVDRRAVGRHGRLVHHPGRSAGGDLYRGGPSRRAAAGRPHDFDRRVQPRRRLACRHERRRSGGAIADPARSAIPAFRGPGLLLGIPLLGFYYWCTNQSIVQRMLSAKNIDHARWGALFAGLLKLPVLFLIVLPGTCALLLFPKLPRPDLVYPNLILRLLPPGLVGLVVAGFVAATMVSIASMLNSASTLITMDVIKQFKPTLVGFASGAHRPREHRRTAGRRRRLGAAAAAVPLACGNTCRPCWLTRCRRWLRCFWWACSGAAPTPTAPRRPCWRARLPASRCSW